MYTGQQMQTDDLLADIARGAGTNRWQAAHLAAALRRSLAEQEAARENTLTCGYCGRRLFKVVVDRKSAWTHEALEDGQTCRLITF